ncbi:alcohol dehydrogenase -like domain-containing protein [Colletotrichum kahawae]|uniref:Alcohol dehydrogenase -like domain-containing protein n=1 Tax=Colletotrichum kahawae TaxID=34407 RepID=A0AAD9XXQ2_COLKA|nr:alcohol dehydrogenase -like domain-containing protein [Colletotrichum kahawae]
MAAATPLPETMTAIQVVAYNAPYELTSVPVPSALGPHDILVKVAVASYCHTDSLFHAGALPLPLPITASHEGAGTVVAVGAAVANFTIGDRAMGETETMLEHIAEHGIKLESNVFHGLDKIYEALELVNSGKISGKAVIVVDEEQVKNDEKIGAKY